MTKILRRKSETNIKKKKKSEMSLENETKTLE